MASKMNQPLLDFTKAANADIELGIQKATNKDFEGAIPHLLNGITNLNNQIANFQRIFENTSAEHIETIEDQPMKDEENRVKDIIESCIETELKPVSFSELIDLEVPIKDLMSTITLPFHYPSAFELGIKPFSTFLFFGLPGTGKTLLAKAVASFSKKYYKTTFFNASASKLLSKWQSETEKALIGLFERAEREEKSIIFFDEVDELLSHKKDADSDTSSRLKSLFLTCTDGINGGLNRTILIAATNRPWSIEAAAWSRFQKKYYVKLPNAESRIKLFKKEIGSLPSKITSADMEILSNRTSGFTGRDIKNVVVSSWIRNLQNHTKEKKTADAIPPLEMKTILGICENTKSSIRFDDKTSMEEFIRNEFGGIQTQRQVKGRPAFFGGS